MIDFDKQLEIRKAYNVLPQLVTALQRSGVSRQSKKFNLHQDFLVLLKYGFIDELNPYLKHLGVQSLPVGAPYIGKLPKPVIVNIIQQLLATGYNFTTIGKNFNCSASTVNGINVGNNYKLELEYLGITNFPIRKIQIKSENMSQLKLQSIVKDLKASVFSIEDLSSKYGLTHEVLQNINAGVNYGDYIKTLGVDSFPISTKYRTKLTDSQIEEAVKLLKANDKTMVELTHILGITKQELTFINLGRTYADTLKRLKITKFPIRPTRLLEPFTLKQYTSIVKDLRAGLNSVEIVKKYNLASNYKDHIHYINKGCAKMYRDYNAKLGITTFPIRPKEPRLTKEQLKEIVDLILEVSVPLIDIDIKYGLPNATSLRINKGAKYRKELVELGYTVFPLSVRKKQTKRPQISSEIIGGVVKDLQGNKLSQDEIASKWGLPAMEVSKINRGVVAAMYKPVLERMGLTTFPIRIGPLIKPLVTMQQLQIIVDCLQNSSATLGAIGSKTGVNPKAVQEINKGERCEKELKLLGITSFPIRK